MPVKTLERDKLSCSSSFLKVAENSFKVLSKGLMGHYNHTIPVDVKIMASTNCQIIGEQVAVNSVAQ